MTTEAESRVLKLQQQRTNVNKEGLSITLLGWVIAGKSLAGNVILNRKAFVADQSTLQCVSDHGEVDGRPVTVLDTPSWFKYFPSQYTPEWIKSEILKSVGEAVTCLLLVIPADTSFKEEQRKVTEENMRLLGEQVWRHTIVLFTCGDMLEDMTIEEHIESEGEALQWVIEKCGNRYHIFNNEDRENRVQVTELLQKIDEMVTRNSLFHLNTETVCEIHEEPEMDTQEDTSEAESDLLDTVRLVDEEWRRRDKEFLNRISETITTFPRNTDMDFPSDCNENEKRTLQLKEQIAETLNQEWRRREEAVMRRFQEVLSKVRCAQQQKYKGTQEAHVFDEEIIKRDKELLKRVSEMISDFPRRADRSMPFTPELSGTSLTTKDQSDEKVSQSDSKSLNRGTLQPKDQIKEMLDREWTRREEALMARFMEILSELRYDLRVVVFGGKFSGKTTLINAVFGKELFPNKKRTAQCKKVWDNVCGRDLTLVDTPGWWKHFPLSDTPDFLKQELVRGVYLCDPGPHAVLVVIEIDLPFTEKHRKAVEDHLGLLGDQIWTHALIVFTRSYALRDRTIEEHIETEGEPLQWVIERCGNRYHVFDNADFDTSQVMKLLEKIEGIVHRNDGSYFQIEAEKLEVAVEWKMTVKAKAESRVLKLQQRNLNKEELRITLLGWVIAGKSLAGNVILNRKAFAPGQSTLKCVTAHGEVDGRPVTVLDTPSWFKYFPSQYTPKWIHSEILKSVGEAVTCLLLVIPADTSFKEEQRKVTEENMRLLGEQVWRHTIVLFTCGDMLEDMSIEEHIESEGEALQWVIEKCGNRYHVFNNEDRENRVQVTELLQKISEMMVRNSSFHLNTETVSDVQAGQDMDTQEDTNEAESDLQDIVRLVDIEWRRKDKEFHNRILKLIAEFPRKADVDFLPDVSELSSKTQDDHGDELSQTELQICSHQKGQCTLQLKGPITEMLNHEWSRREEAVMRRFQEKFNELKCESQVLGEELKRKQNQFLNRVSEAIAEFPRRTDRSMEFPPGLSEMSSKTLTEDLCHEEVSQTESHTRNQNTLQLKDHMKKMLHLELTRREEALMGRLLEMMNEFRCEAQSEPSEDEKELSRQKVSQWFERCSEAYASVSGDSVSDT
ncbi:GTPase IMAP family member 8-like [Hoplias malabaricus]|uniref:GTPase IMAP family member 8-like n=1 Tax=Hoplias malabaricus TaxID=27720 RepID=UPI003461D4BF